MSVSGLFKIFISTCVVLSASRSAFADTTLVPLLDALKAAEDFSPRLKGARFEQAAAAENVRAKKANYLPDLSAAAVASTGNPGSFSMFDVDSDMSGSQRVGAGAGLILKQDIWDFGRTSSAVNTAEAQRLVEEKRHGLLKTDVDRVVLRTYIHCSYFKAQVDNARLLAEQARILSTETDKFVRSGQRSIVERYLVDTQVKEAETQIAEFMERVRESERRLAIEMGRPENTSAPCTALLLIPSQLDNLEKSHGPAPVLEVQKAQMQIAQFRLEQSRAENRPVLFGMATGGYFDSDRLADKWNYAAGIGIKMPLFDGFRIESEIERESARLKAEEANLNATQLNLDRVNSQYDEQIKALKVRLEFLEREKTLAKQVFDLAKKRYMRLEGSMVDLRDSIRNMSRVLQSTDEAYRELLIARGEKLLANGARN